MSLGVLNNLNAMYAANNLNNTSNSLSNVLNQLSSGSKINSGADDAAGLSLVNGLQANSVALSQSITNAAEGVGLLKVADGALSQVTNLLNRAVTLATEASNGTLNAAQDTAANQEYQSILSEISNIGSTTTYNGQTVFGSKKDIYTGDSSVQGASIDSLNIRELSSSNVGDSGGVMSYSNGQSGVFLNLSTVNKNAQATDTLNSGGTSTINVNYMVKGANGASNPAATSITVGGNSGYDNTANGLISAINGSGLGLTASFTTQAQAGITGGGTETGIQISGGLISVGVDASTASTSGTLNPSDINGNLTLGQTISVSVGGTNVASVTIDKTNNTLEGLAKAINFNDSAHPQTQNSMVTATVVVNSAGKASLQLNDASSTGGELKATSTPGNVVPNILTPGTVVSSDPVALNFTAGVAGQAGGVGSATLSIAGTGSNSTTQALTGSITLSNGTNTKTFVMGGAAGVSGNTVTLGSSTSTLSDLAAAITANLGATAVASSTGIAIASVGTGTQITEAAGSTLSAALSVGQQTNVAGIAATSGTDGQTTLSMTGDANGFKGDGSDTLATGTTLTLTNGSGSAYTFTMDAGPASGVGTTTENTGGLTTGDLVTAINTTTATSGMSAAISNGKIVVSSSTVNTTIAAVSTLTGTSATFTDTGSGTAPALSAQSKVNITSGVGAPAASQGSLTETGTTLTGDITVNNAGVAFKVIMGTGATDDTGTAGQITLSAANSTMSGVMAALNAKTGTTNVVASLDETAGGSASGLTLTANNGAAANIVVGGTGLTAANSLSFTTPTLGGSGQAQSALLSLTNAGVLAQGGSVAEDGTISGSISITTTTGGHTVTDTFNMGSNASNTAGTSTTNGTYNVNSGKLSDLLAAINTAGTDNLNMTATQDLGTGGIFMQAKNTTDTGLAASSNTLSTSMDLSASTPSTVTYTPASVNVTNGGTNSASDVLTEGTSLQLTNSATGVATTFTMGGVTGAGTVGVGTAGDSSTQTMQALADAISGAGLNLSATAGSAGLTITSTAPGGAGTITVGTNTLTDGFSTGTPVATAGTGPTAATNAVATINTTKGMSTAGTDPLAGQIKLTNSSNGTAVTFNMGGTAGVSGNVVTLGAGTSTLNDLVSAINSNATLGMTASVNSSTGALQVQSNATATAITVGGSGLTDATSEAFTNSAAGAQSVQSTGSFSLAGSGNTFTAGNQLTGQIDISVGNATKTFVMGGTAGVNGNVITLGKGASSVQDLENAISTSLGVNASLSGDGSKINLQDATAANTSTISVANSTLKDTMGAAPATATLGTYASASDKLTGTLAIKVGGVDKATLDVTGMSVTELVNKINTGKTDGTGTTPDSMGVHASLVSDSSGFQTLTLTSDTYGAAGTITNGTAGTQITDAAQTATLSYSQGSAYNIGISNGANGVYDSSTQSAPTSGASAAFANLSSSGSGSSGVATISYSDGAGVSLAATDLSNQADAQLALNALNKAITAVAAQDGYIGAQINTLNSVSSVLATQQQNVVAAQNAVQATDYAQATSACPSTKF